MPFLAPRSQTSPSLTALLLESGERFSYAALEAQTRQVTQTLLQAGLQPGDRLGLWLDDPLALVLHLHAALRLGLTLLPFNRRLSPPEFEEQLQTASPRALLTEQGLRLLPSVPRPPAPGLLLFTSGTTARPKAAHLPLSALQAAVRASAQRLGTHTGHTWLLCLPLYHIGGLSILLRAAHDGLTVALQPRFQAEQTDQFLRRSQANLVSLVPTMLHRLLPLWEEKGAPPALECILLGGAAAPQSLLTRALQLNLPLALTYGLTEACSQVTTALPETVRRKPGCAGPPLPGVSLRIVGEGGQSLPPGHSGQIAVRSQALMSGYLNAPPLQGELLTGDLGNLDEEGDLWVLTRRSDLIVSGGENIRPEEVEEALLQHPAIAEACVVGLPDPEWGQIVAAAIVPACAVQPEALEAFLRPRLAGYKLPRRLRLVQSLPRTASGKIQRRRAAEEFDTLPACSL